MKKKQLRQEYLNKRKTLSLSAVADLSSDILKNFEAVRIAEPDILLSYSPLAETNEFNVGFCEHILSRKKPAIRVAWPKISLDSISMHAHLVDKNKLFVKNQFNILEPLDGDVIMPTLIDMVFVPLVIFDTRGYRVGYGKGFYDRYLAECRSDVIKVGFCFFEGEEAIDDINEFDVPLDLCITPTRIYEF